LNKIVQVLALSSRNKALHASQDTTREHIPGRLEASVPQCTLAYTPQLCAESAISCKRRCSTPKGLQTPRQTVFLACGPKRCCNNGRRLEEPLIGKLCSCLHHSAPSCLWVCCVAESNMTLRVSQQPVPDTPRSTTELLPKYLLFCPQKPKHGTSGLCNF
jgi:hypothetical protein